MTEDEKEKINKKLDGLFWLGILIFACDIMLFVFIGLIIDKINP